MELLRQKTFSQSGKTRITLRKLESPYSCSCERLVDGKKQEAVYGLSSDAANRKLLEWEQFEYEIKSIEL